MTKKEQIALYHTLKKGDIIQIRLTSLMARKLGLKVQDVEAVVKNKVCKIGERQTNGQGAYAGQIIWDTGITISDYLQNHVDQDNTPYICKVRFLVQIAGVSEGHPLSRVTLDVKDFHSIQVLMPNRLKAIFDKAYDYAQANQNSVDYVWDAMDQFKPLKDLEKPLKHSVYRTLAKRCGLNNTVISGNILRQGLMAVAAKSS